MLRPQMHLIAAGRLYPKAWRQADQFRADRGKGTLPAWPLYYCNVNFLNFVKHPENKF